MSYCPYCKRFTQPGHCPVDGCGGIVCGMCGNCNRRERFHPDATPQHARPSSTRFRLAFVALVALTLALALAACGVSGAASDPGFSCRIGGASAAAQAGAIAGVNWIPEVRITGPTPEQGVLNVNLAYFDAAGNETGSDDYIPIGFSGVSVPAGKSLTVLLTRGYDPGLNVPPAACQVTGHM